MTSVDPCVSGSTRCFTRRVLFLRDRPDRPRRSFFPGFEYLRSTLIFTPRREFSTRRGRTEPGDARACGVCVYVCVCHRYIVRTRRQRSREARSPRTEKENGKRRERGKEEPVGLPASCPCLSAERADDPREFRPRMTFAYPVLSFSIPERTRK